MEKKIKFVVLLLVATNLAVMIIALLGGRAPAPKPVADEAKTNSVTASPTPR